MKKLVVLVLLALIANVSFAQEVYKDKLVANGDLIEVVKYHDNGAIAQTGFYTLQNKLEGKWVSYNRSGDRVAVATYDSGRKVGTWLFYQGDTMREVIYEDARVAKVNTYTIQDTRVVSNK